VRFSGVTDKAVLFEFQALSPDSNIQIGHAATPQQLAKNVNRRLNAQFSLRISIRSINTQKEQHRTRSM
jgi:hypothetical protein